MPDTPYADSALRYMSHGWSPLPLGDRPRLKALPPSGYTGNQGDDPDEDQIAEWCRTRGDRNIGIRLPAGVVGIDVDDYDDKPGADTMTVTAQRHGKLPRTWVSTSRPGLSGIRWFRGPTDTIPGKLIHPDDDDTSGVEIIQHTHRYAVVPPSIHPTGGTYQWITPEGEPVDNGRIPTPAELPELPPAWIDHIRKECSCWVEPSFDWKRYTSERRDPVQETFEKWGGRLTASYGRHDAALAGVMALSAFHHRGWPGAAEALQQLKQAFYTSLGDSRNQREAEAEWKRMLVGAQAKATSTTIPQYEAPRTAPDNPAEAYTPADPRVAEELERIRVREAARKLYREPQEVDGTLFGTMLDYASGDLANLPQPETLLGPYFQAAGVNVLYGRGASYKSFVAQSAAASIATGEPWGHYAVRKSQVAVYWAAEGRAGLQQRFWAWETHHDTKIPSGRLLVPEKWPRLDDPALGELIADELEGVGCEWLTVDTLNRTKGRLKENDSDDLGSTLFDVLTPTLLRGIGVCIVHHSGWSNDHARGSSALFDNADQVYKVTKDGATITMHDEKGKDNAERPVLYMQMIESMSSVVVTPTEERPLHQVARELLTVLEDGNWWETDQLAKSSGFDRKRIHEHLTPLVGGLIEKEFAGRGKSARYRTLTYGKQTQIDGRIGDSKRPKLVSDTPPDTLPEPW